MLNPSEMKTQNFIPRNPVHVIDRFGGTRDDRYIKQKSIESRSEYHIIISIQIIIAGPETRNS